jgi:hypothetical protein
LTDDPQPAVLRLLVSPQARRGETITAAIDATNVPETVVKLEPSDRMVISQPHTVVAGAGTFQQTVRWTVEHVQEGTTSWVEITVFVGSVVFQKGLCKVVG